ncbi:hypothetical protein F2Q68_00007581 [Brassica cretica]|uniref:glucan endo-1,3-beta-D-glucosidase n=1 Tax=Brassica cretica TaxID=69181 RepID=A0A8S9L4A9_BRACR|nr:hypothetical protein F2Q68_00007581 [Brassica cretica]
MFSVGDLQNLSLDDMTEVQLPERKFVFGEETAVGERVKYEREELKVPQPEPVVVIESVSKSESECDDFQVEEEVHVPPSLLKVVCYCEPITHERVDEKCKRLGTRPSTTRDALTRGHLERVKDAGEESKVPQPELVVVIESVSESESGVMTFKLKKNQAEEEEIHGSLSTPKIVRYYVNQAHTKHVDEECKTVFLFFLSCIVLIFNYGLVTTAASNVGLNYGLLGDNLPPPSNVITLYKSIGITKVRIFDPNTEVLNALRGHRDIKVTVGVRDQDLAPLAASEDAVKAWFATNIEP